VLDALPITNLEAASDDRLAALLAGFSRRHRSDESCDVMRWAHKGLPRSLCVN